MAEMSVSFTWSPTTEARAVLFGSDGWWAHLRASVSEGFCPRCQEGLEPVEMQAQASGYCARCDTTFWTGGPDKQWAADGEQAGHP